MPIKSDNEIMKQFCIEKNIEYDMLDDEDKNIIQNLSEYRMYSLEIACKDMKHAFIDHIPDYIKKLLGGLNGRRNNS